MSLLYRCTVPVLTTAAQPMSQSSEELPTRLASAGREIVKVWGRCATCEPAAAEHGR
jgi:hypothetical protein